MPVHSGKDEIGYYFQWGNHGHKYYYNNKLILSRENAKRKAHQQAIAAYSHGYHH